MKQNKQKIYVDTSVIGGVHDVEFKDASEQFFALVKNRADVFQLVTSSIVADEINKVPQHVIDFYNIIKESCQVVDLSNDALELRNRYIEANILGYSSLTDALHVSLATVSNCTMIVSWNFKHIVNFQKIPLFNAINRIEGFHEIGIYSPLEIINYE